MPAGTEVAGVHTLWVKDRPGFPEPWTREDGAHISDGAMDRLLGDGATLMFIPSRPQQPMVEPCGVCRDWHYNACPALWGGAPEMVEPARRAPSGGVS